jgi:hypothetical protein
MENIYYRELTLPFKMSLPEVKFPTAHGQIKLDRELIDVNFIDWLASLELKIGFSEVFLKKPTDIDYPWALHLDGRQIDNHIKINFIVNPGASVMRWWQLRPGCSAQFKMTVINTPYMWAAREDVEMVAESSLLEPTIVNAGQLHNVENVDVPRLCYSFMLLNKHNLKVKFNQIEDTFKGYLK